MIQPRVIRAKDAPKYLGVDKNRFYLEIKPRLRPVKMPGAKSRAIGYDRLELDAWWEEYKAVGRSKEDEWNAKSQTVSSGDQSQVEASTNPSTSKRCTEVTSYVTRARQVIQKRRNGNSGNG